MYEPHENPTLDLPELNEKHIERNAENIRFNRRMMIVLSLGIVMLIVLVAVKQDHDIHECENRLWHKLMKNKDSPNTSGLEK